MSKARWSIVGVFAAVVLGLGIWRVTDDGTEPLRAALTDMRPDSSSNYTFPVWATDGRTPIKLAGVGGEMTLLDPIADYIADPPTGVALPGGTGAQPLAVASLPGRTNGPWVAVARTRTEKDGSDDPRATDRPLVWHGPRLTSSEPSSAADAVELPVDLITNESEGSATSIDAAVARLDGQEVAVVATHQNEENDDPDVADFSVCRLDDCRWQAGSVPRNTAPVAVGSTGDGLVAFTTSKYPTRNDIWYAGDADLTWRRIGSAPPRATLQLIQDGAGVATLVWERGEGDEIAVQTVRDGELRDAVPFTELEGDRADVNTALKVQGRWYLGGSRSSTARLELRYATVEPVLWELVDETWKPLDDALLSGQADQAVEVLFTGGKAELRAVSSSPERNIYMTWRFTRERD